MLRNNVIILEMYVSCMCTLTFYMNVYVAVWMKACTKCSSTLPLSMLSYYNSTIFVLMADK